MFGCLCYPYLRDFNKHKLDFHASKCIFIGYSFSYEGYNCLTSTSQVQILRHVAFYENIFLYYSTNTFSSSEANLVSETLVSN